MTNKFTKYYIKITTEQHDSDHKPDEVSYAPEVVAYPEYYVTPVTITITKYSRCNKFSKPIQYYVEELKN